MPPTADILPRTARIAVLKAGGLGDLVFALPAMDALRAAYPAAHVALITSSAGSELMRGRPGPVDEVLEAPPFEGPPALSAEGRAKRDHFCRTMRDRRLDAAVQIHGGGANSNPLVTALGARLTVGLQAPDAPPLDLTVPYEYLRSEILRCLEVVGLLGAAPVSVEPRLQVTAADRDAAERTLPDDGRPLAIIHPGAGDPRRWWPAGKFAAVARSLSAEGARVAVIGTPGEQALVRVVVDGVGDAVDLCGRLSLPALAGLLTRAGVVVSNDSGPLHLASAVGARTVGVYWCGNVVNAGPATSTRHRVAASWRIDCPVCGTSCMAEGCAHTASFVADVPVADVRRAALGLLADSSPRLAR